MSSNKKFNLVPYLAFEERPNSYIPIDLSNLEIFRGKKLDGTIKSLDEFTMKFSEEELVDAIKRSNTVVLDNYDVPLVIVYKNHPLPLITNQNINALDMADIFHEALENKELANKLKNKIQSIMKKYMSNYISEEGIQILIKNFQVAINNKNYNYLMYIFNNLSYEGQRELAFYFYEMNKEKENNQILQRKYDEVN